MVLYSASVHLLGYGRQWPGIYYLMMSDTLFVVLVRMMVLFEQRFLRILYPAREWPNSDPPTAILGCQRVGLSLGLKFKPSIPYPIGIRIV